MARHMDVAIRVEGAKELRRAARKAGKDVQKELRESHKATANIIAQGSKPEAPKRSGRLAGNIRAGGTQSAARVVVGGARLPYAGPIHFGWRRRNIEPNPFIYRTMKDKWQAVMEAYTAAVDKVGDLIRTK